jgi:hypothetical protein
MRGGVLALGGSLLLLQRLPEMPVCPLAWRRSLTRQKAAIADRELRPAS